MVGRLGAVVGILLCLGMQAVNSDFFPPRISISQYGVGPRGWIFTCWAVGLAVAAKALQVGSGARRYGVSRWITVGGLGLVVMAVVRTDADGLQQSLHAKVHMGASFVALAVLPIGMALAMNQARARWRRTGWVLVVLIAGSLIMVLASAAGMSTLGLDGPDSWALWQALAVSMDMVFVGAFAISTFPGQQAGPPSSDGDTATLGKR